MLEVSEAKGAFRALVCTEPVKLTNPSLEISAVYTVPAGFPPFSQLKVKLPPSTSVNGAAAGTGGRVSVTVETAGLE